MLYYDGIYIYEWIDINKISELKEYDIWNYWYFSEKVFMSQAWFQCLCVCFKGFISETGVMMY